MVNVLVKVLPHKVLVRLVFSALRAWVKQTDNGLDDLVVELLWCFYKREWEKAGELIPLIVIELSEMRQQRK